MQDDTISRQAVLDVIDEEWICNAEYEFRPLVESIKQLPSVRPQQNCEDIAMQEWLSHRKVRNNMANIELVIKIDNQTYNNFVHNEYSRADVIAIHTALINATPLPKGHGRILDEKDILDTKNNDGDWYDLVDMPAYIAGVKAIIEADKERKAPYDEYVVPVQYPLIDEDEDACEKCLYAEETDGSHCYECVKGESRFKAESEESDG